MAYIKNISFSKVGKMEGCTCDRCGQYIQNIWSVTYKDGVIMHFGIDCFEKLNKESRLTQFGIKEMKKALKSIEDHQMLFKAEKAKTAETDKSWQRKSQDKDDAWYGSSFEEWHTWMLEVWWPERFKEDQKRIDRFSKVNFNR